MLHTDKIAHAGSERGSALVYILIAIALLAALTLSFMEPSSQQTQSQNTFKVVSEVQSQSEFIRSAIHECVLAYPGGDSGAIGAGLPQKNNPYPIMPDDAYFDASCGVGESAANNYVSGLRCPGKPGDDPCHDDIFGSASGKFMPPSPPLFGEWHYYAGTDGVFLWLETDKTDAFIQTALQKLDDQFGGCEADVIDATSGDVDLDSDTTLVCPSGNSCFRIWLIAKATAVYQAGGPEATAGCP
ncbi:MAG: hypothetical protein H6868_04165 [Rhodospirillales bacterium]|nr:hypothetical protein [Rhodospirillales bacterium]